MIINSMLQTDLYKLTMQNAVLQKYPGVEVQYEFNDRKPQLYFDDHFLRRFNNELDRMSEIKLSDNEASFLKSRCPFLPGSYVEYLRNYRYDPSEITASTKNGELNLRINGSWERTILWEVPLMALISELRFEDEKFDLQAYKNKLDEKGRILDNTVFADFGTRRRRSSLVQNLVVDTLKKYDGFVGTSNVALAMHHNVKPIGTMAHEWIMGISALESLRHANRYALRAWNDVYQGNLGVALTDTFGSEAFFQDFDSVLARLFDGVRQDSGNPFEFGEKAIAHYEKLRIDPKHKTIVFSDSLNPTLALELWNAFSGRIKVSFGIGTDLTNSVPGSPALNIVIKLTKCNGVWVVKLSDSPSKAIGESDALRVAKWTFFGQGLYS